MEINLTRRSITRLGAGLAAGMLATQSADSAKKQKKQHKKQGQPQHQHDHHDAGRTSGHDIHTESGFVLRSSAVNPFLMQMDPYGDHRDYTDAKVQALFDHDVQLKQIKLPKGQPSGYFDAGNL